MLHRIQLLPNRQYVIKWRPRSPFMMLYLPSRSQEMSRIRGLPPHWHFYNRPAIFRTVLPNFWLHMVRRCSLVAVSDTDESTSPVNPMPSITTVSRAITIVRFSVSMPTLMGFQWSRSRKRNEFRLAPVRICFARIMRISTSQPHRFVWSNTYLNMTLLKRVY